MNKQSTIDPIWYFWVPALVMVGQILIETMLPGAVLGELHSEWGPHETMQFAVISTALITAITALCQTDWQNKKHIGLWFALAAVCCLFVTGEEISWGQHIFHWQTSEYWQGVNDQSETNLHNTSAWLDQKPRLILFISIVFGGLIIPLLQKYKPSWLPARFEKLYPARILWFVAMMVLVPYLTEEIADDVFSIHTFARVSEVQELYMYYFVLLYLWDLRAREILKA